MSDLKQRGRKKFNTPIFFAEIISAFMVEKSCDAKKPETRCRPPNATAVRKNPYSGRGKQMIVTQKINPQSEF